MPEAPVVTLSVTIDPIPTGAGGIVRGETITVTGTAGIEVSDTDDEPGDPGDEPTVPPVKVLLGRSGSFDTIPTGLTGTGQPTWSTWTTGPLLITGVVNNRLLITAVVGAGPLQETADTVVIVDRTFDEFYLTTPDDITEKVVDGRAAFEVAGGADDELSPVVAVEWELERDGHPLDRGLARPDAPGDWKPWTITMQLPLGTYRLRVRARDGEANESRWEDVTLRAVETFQPQDPTDVFAQAEYLKDLLWFFAGPVERIIDGGEPPRKLTPEHLETAYRQPFVDLTNPNNREAAETPVHQVRVCVEVLRALLAGIGKSLPAAEESKYRRAAYAALLRGLGTSFDEIRRARGDEAAQTRLAARLGVDRSDRLDQLLLLPAQVTEARLEQLFGLQDTTRDPLVRGPQPLLLTWQLNRLRAQWQEQDDAARVYGEIPLPIIDPDLLTETDFRTRNRNTDTAFALWHARRVEMTALFNQVDDHCKSQSRPLARPSNP